MLECSSESKQQHAYYRGYYTQWRSQPNYLVPLCKFQVIFKLLSLFISLKIHCFHSQWIWKYLHTGLNPRAGYATDYTVARGYEYCFRVVNKLFPTRENNVHIFKLPCNVLFTIWSEVWTSEQRRYTSRGKTLAFFTCYIFFISWQQLGILYGACAKFSAQSLGRGSEIQYGGVWIECFLDLPGFN